MSLIPHLLRQNQVALTKTASYYVIHVVVAAVVAFAVTGSWAAATALSLLEPTVQAFAYFLHEKTWSRLPAARYRTYLKTGTYYVMHITVASCVAYAVTGDLVAALTLSLLEPTVQMFFFFVHEKLWEKKAHAQRQMRSSMRVCASATGCSRAPTCASHCAWHAA